MLLNLNMSKEILKEMLEQYSQTDMIIAEKDLKIICNFISVALKEIIFKKIQKTKKMSFEDSIVELNQMIEELDDFVKSISFIYIDYIDFLTKEKSELLKNHFYDGLSLVSMDQISLIKKEINKKKEEKLKLMLLKKENKEAMLFKDREKLEFNNIPKILALEN